MYCRPYIFDRGESEFEKYFFPTQRTVFLTSMFFVLVLFLFSISKIFYVLVLFLFANKNKFANMFSNNLRVLSSLLMTSNYDFNDKNYVGLLIICLPLFLMMYYSRMNGPKTFTLKDRSC